MMSNKTTIDTTDIDLSAALSADGFPLVDLRRNAEDRTVFSFADPGNRFDKVRQQFLSGELLLPADRVLRCLRDLKYRLHGVGR